MGNHPSTHRPLERGSHGNGLRLSQRRERSSPGRMDRLRKSFRDSFRRRRESSVSESSKPHQWGADENAVRSGTCAFHVKYLGCVEVYESRGMQVCEEALKVLRNSRRRPVRAILHVSGDGLRVVEDETKGLIVDQTIEKVSFCAPDRNHEKGFSYICRDGTTRRWMCHGFLALKEPGERLSHAVGCAFAACLERKQRRDRECEVTMTFDHQTSTFTRTGSFRQSSLTERLQDPRERAIDVVPPARQVYNPFAIERPHATPSMLERQGSFRGFNQLNQASPFKRQLSLRVSDLPSNLERTRSHSLEPTDLSRLPPTQPHHIPVKPPVSPIPEISPSGQDSVSAMCQQLSRGLSLLSSTDDFGPVISQTTTTTNTFVKKLFNNAVTTLPTIPNSSSLDDLKLQNGQSMNNMYSATPMVGNINTNNNNSSNSSNDNNVYDANALNDAASWPDSSSSVHSAGQNHRLTPILNQCGSLSPVMSRGSVNSTPAPHGHPIASVFETPAASPAFSNASTTSLASSGAVGTNQLLSNRSPVPAAYTGDSPTGLATNASVSPAPAVGTAPMSPPSFAPTQTTVTSTVADISGVAELTTPTTAQQITTVQAVPTTADLPKPDQWLGSVTTQATSGVVPTVSPRRAPPLHARALSLGSAAMGPSTGRTGPSDPFDAEWAEIAARNLRQASTTNPFIVPNTIQAFQPEEFEKRVAEYYSDKASSSNEQTSIVDPREDLQ